MNTDKHGKINIFVFATEATEIIEKKFSREGTRMDAKEKRK
jgi:hypothetical protein